MTLSSRSTSQISGIYRSGGVDLRTETKSVPRRANVRDHGTGTEVQVHDDPTQAPESSIIEQQRGGTRYGYAPLGRTQKLVLQLLAEESKTVRKLASDWPGLTESSVRSALDRLGDRRLVDVADRHGEQGRVYRLTPRGVEVERDMTEASDER